jgi:hypothetical protein
MMFYKLLQNLALPIREGYSTFELLENSLVAEKAKDFPELGSSSFP